ncbi:MULTISPECIES: FbpB family small basic protein [Bacillaceae]|nr:MULTISPECIES: FbpB family small basic protein [Bacillaceae]MCF7624138.1 FbpB family small basic protein [Peribacillus frigoritolerans]MCP1095178.1 FbpB family small basic protein [Bacillaceae bacterium OS4b]PRA78565.1 FbpB family small basic protein [Peribacillus simplex]
MSRRRKSYTQLLKENRELLLHDKIEVERIYTKIDQKAINEKKGSKQVQSFIGQNLNVASSH